MIKFYTKEVSYFVHISFKTHNTFIIMPFQKLVCKKVYIRRYLDSYFVIVANLFNSILNKEKGLFTVFY